MNKRDTVWYNEDYDVFVVLKKDGTMIYSFEGNHAHGRWTEKRLRATFTDIFVGVL